MSALAILAAVAIVGPNGPALESRPSAEQIERADAYWQHDQHSAWRKFWIAQSLSAADVATTCIILSQGGHEANPIYGRGASCGKIAGIKAAIGLIQYFLVKREIEADPQRASHRMNIIISIQGVPVIWNLVQLAR